MALCSGGVWWSACGASTTSAPPTTTVRSVPTTTAPPPPPSTTAAPTTTTPPPTTAPPPTTSGPPAYVAGTMCQNGQLEAAAPGPSGEGLGNIDLVIVFTNVSGSPCTLTGYPGVAGLDGQGNQIAQAARTPSAYLLGGLPSDQAAPPTVSLAPGGEASTTVNGHDGPVGNATSCVYYPAFLVTPPNLTASLRVTVPPEGTAGGFPGCTPISVTPVVPGASGHLANP